MGKTAHELPDKNWKLWTRGGTNDVSIENNTSGEEIEIPQELLRKLVAQDIRDEKISILEQAGDNEVLGLPGGHSI